MSEAKQIDAALDAARGVARTVYRDTDRPHPWHVIDETLAAVKMTLAPDVVSGLLAAAIPALRELDVVIGLITSERTRVEMRVVADNLRAAISKATGNE